MKQLMQILAIAFLSVGSLEAKGGGGGRSSSSSSRSSSSYSRPAAPAPKPYVAPAPKPTVAPKQATPAPTAQSAPVSKPNTSVAQTSSRPKSNVEAARYKEAVKSGKTFQTRDSAVADFKATKASSYTSKYTSEPSSRPEHIPSSYRGNDGRNYDVTYNQQGGGYGYWGGGGPGLGTFIMYDMMSDAIMMNAMMDKSNYHVGPPPAQVTHVHKSSGSGWGTFFLTAIIIGGISVGAFFLAKKFL
jgi:hypothetical protein